MFNSIISDYHREMDRIFFQHPRNEQLTYFSHLRRAWTFSFQFLAVSIKAFVHGVCPVLFGSCVSDLYGQLINTEKDKEIELTKLSQLE